MAKTLIAWENKMPKKCVLALIFGAFREDEAAFILPPSRMKWLPSIAFRFCSHTWPSSRKQNFLFFLALISGGRRCIVFYL
jgi:hypothetical protein